MNVLTHAVITLLIEKSISYSLHMMEDPETKWNGHSKGNNICPSFSVTAIPCSSVENGNRMKVMGSKDLKGPVVLLFHLLPQGYKVL